MSFDRCQTCRYAGYCTFPRNRTITECDEYEETEIVPAFDWDLSELNKLGSEQSDNYEE